MKKNTHAYFKIKMYEKKYIPPVEAITVVPKFISDCHVKNFPNSGWLILVQVTK